MKGLSEVEDMLFKCGRCGFCQAHCPTFKATMAEPFVARGRLEIIKANLDNMVEDYSESFINRMNQCLLCGNCAEHCPSGVEVDRIVEAARTSYITGKGSHGVMGNLRRNIAGSGNIAGDEPRNRMLWVNNIEGHSKEIKIGEPAEYAYFTGCVPAFYPSAYSIPQAFVKILKAGSVSFTLLGEEEKCCGYPLAIGGLPGEAVKAAEKNLDSLHKLGVKKIVTGCPSCYHMWKDTYPELLDYDPGIQVLHSTELLLRLITEGKLRFKEVPMEVTYHDPCDLGRKSGIFDAPREILKSLPGVVLKEMKYNRLDARCCGGGGNLEMNDAELSGKVSQDRVQQALDTGAAAIVSACQQCKRTLQAGARAMRARVKIFDICEIVCNALDQ
ncbi:MAG: (Fe-S)-binding protein [Bacillota bacterium]|nr:(Fe-S)-binding protein [Bacillota bacterium]